MSQSSQRTTHNHMLGLLQESHSYGITNLLVLQTMWLYVDWSQLNVVKSIWTASMELSPKIVSDLPWFLQSIISHVITNGVSIWTMLVSILLILLLSGARRMIYPSSWMPSTDLTWWVLNSSGDWPRSNIDKSWPRPLLEVVISTI